MVRNKAFVMNFSGEDGVDVGKLKETCWMLRVANGKKVKVILKRVLVTIRNSVSTF